MYLLSFIWRRLLHPYNRSELKANLAVGVLILAYGALTLANQFLGTETAVVEATATGLHLVQL